MPSKVLPTTFIFLAGALAASAATAPETLEVDLDRQFTATVRPFVERYCTECHSGDMPEAQIDLSAHKNLAAVVADHFHWELALEKLQAKEMPPDDAEHHPTDETRQQVIAWLDAVMQNEARKSAGDPGIVLARRLSNAEYNYTIRDLTGVDIQPTREFPVDPANQFGFDNSGESLAMSPALLTKYLQAAREVASHLVLKPDRIAFAPHPMLVETDRDKYCINQIMDFYRRQATDYADYFHTAWRYKHRAAVGRPTATLSEFAAEHRVSPKYLATVWSALEETKEEVGPLAKLQILWRALPAPAASASDVRSACESMRDYVAQLRAKLEPRFENLSVRGISGTSQPFRMWLNRQYASHRRTYNPAALQVEGETPPAPEAAAAKKAVAASDADDNDDDATGARAARENDPDLFVPAGDRDRYEAAFARFSSIFPDAFYVAERGRNQLDTTKDRGRYLSAGFHNLMGYFRDDQPLCELLLDDAQRKELDAMWQEMDFVASANTRTYVQFYFNESGQAREAAQASESEAAAPEPAEKDVTSEPMIRRVADVYLGRARASGNETAIQAVADHFETTNASIRWLEQARVEAEPRHLDALLQFAARAYRRPLTTGERDDLLAYYRSLREEAKLSHEEAMRDLVVSVLMYPDFCYRIDLVEPVAGIQALSDYALASRLSYFLWSSMPDDELLAVAAEGKLREPEVLAAQARRMLKDDRVRGLTTEFGGNWLDFRRFEEHNAVDRERFSSFDHELRQAMFEEPVRFMLNVIQQGRPVLDFLYANDTFVNPVLAKHYEMPAPTATPDEWVRVEDAHRYGRGGLLPMAVFLTKNAPGLRTSPVKRGYWVVKRVLGEHIPPPPAVVPEIPHDETKLDLPLRDMLARHREDKSCASCHARFDSLGLVFEGYGPVGERREKDLAGRVVEVHATFPNGTEGAGFDGLRDYVRQFRQDDFIDGLCRKLLAYGLGRSLMLSDDATVEQMRAHLAQNGYRFESLVETIVTSPQFLTKRGRDDLAMKGD